MSGPAPFSFKEKGTFPRAIALASYPRSGNSLLRRLLEEVTEVYTGSDTRPDRTMAKQLIEFGMLGEGIVDSRVLFVKTHFPERRGHRPFVCDRAIVVVRNPLDAIDSYFNMVLTNSHTESIAESEYARFAPAWDEFVRREADQWARFHNHWLHAPVPVLFLRFEDLVDPAQRPALLLRAAAFAAAGRACPALPVLAEAHARRARVLAACASSQQGRVYKPRSGTVGGSLAHYSRAQAEAVLRTAWHTAAALGYAGIAQEVAAFHGLPPEAAPAPPPRPAPGETADLPPAVAVLRGDADAVARARRWRGVDSEEEPRLPRADPGTVAAAREWLRGRGALLGSLRAHEAPPGPGLLVGSGTVVCEGRVLATGVGAGTGAAGGAGAGAGIADEAAAEAAEAGLDEVGAVITDGAKYRVNMTFQLRPCTAEDPWGRGMKWVDHIGVTAERPVQLRARAPKPISRQSGP